MRLCREVAMPFTRPVGRRTFQELALYVALHGPACRREAQEIRALIRGRRLPFFLRVRLHIRKQSQNGKGNGRSDGASVQNANHGSLKNFQPWFAKLICLTWPRTLFPSPLQSRALQCGILLP